MRFWALVLILVASAFAQKQSTSNPDSQPITVPIKLDHNRIIVDVQTLLPNGTTQQILAWIDNGDPDLHLSPRLAKLMGLNVTCDANDCYAPPPRDITIGGLKISLASVKQALVSPKPVGTAFIASGLSAEINIPSTILRNYDILIDYPGLKLTMAPSGTLKFNGVKAKALVNHENGLIQIPSRIETKKYNLALDVGAAISFLDPDLFAALAAAHPTWPHMTGAIGPANLWGADGEPNSKLMRVDRLQYGPIFLTNVAVVALPKEWIGFFAKRAGVPTAGLLGANALLNYRIGLDYARSTVYFEIGRTFNFPDFDVVGLTLRPEDDGRFLVIGVAEVNGQPFVPSSPGGVQIGDHLVAIDSIPVRGSTMGQVWSQLAGSPGQERILTVERGGKEFTVIANVQHFLGAAPAEDDSKGKTKKK